ncbi:hypothetical protein ALC62_07702 [Cyphomyrmex costatus]|uniref:Uncharacterized protein n=1 Tax=Cyphomyrmex costatus TaxID=456900 RepID=A0A195CLD0_9HYME|nr:hypothetical protein ALC62_07702 [Cyphomyrmex costatus]
MNGRTMTSHHSDIPLRLIIDHYDGCLMILCEDASTNGRDGHVSIILIRIGRDVEVLGVGNLVCCASDVLEGGRGVVRVAVTVSELLRFHQTRSPLQTSSSMPNHVPA